MNGIPQALVRLTCEFRLALEASHESSQNMQGTSLKWLEGSFTKRPNLPGFSAGLRATSLVRSATIADCLASRPCGPWAGDVRAALSARTWRA